LLIASQPLSFITGSSNDPYDAVRSFENIDIHQLLKNNDVGHLRFTSVLRMNATFPFVLPMVTLPTSPGIQIMDAGTRDNYGGKTMMEWMNAMREWIRENTSGVVIVQIRDTKKMLTGDEIKKVTFLDKFVLPFSNMYGNFTRTQDFDQEELLKMGLANSSYPVDLISINLREDAKDRISLSWHLTRKEKRKIKKAVFSPENQRSIGYINEHLRKSKH
jgi:hypothetical protein